MIKITSFFSLPIPEQRIGEVYSLANSHPRNVGQVHGTVRCLVPPWGIVRDYKEHRINEAEYTVHYRHHIKRNWREVRRWLDGLSASDELYLCCWERTGFCHRFLVAKLIQKFRPDIELRVT